MKHLLRRCGFVITLTASLSASGCSFLSSGPRSTGTTHTAAKKSGAAAKKVSADTIPNAAEVGL